MITIVYAESVIKELDRLLNVLNEPFLFVVRVLVTIAVILVFFYFFWGLVDYIRHRENTDLENAKKRIFWGILGIFVLVSIWGIIYLLQNSILGGAQGTADIELLRSTKCVSGICLSG